MASVNFDCSRKSRDAAVKVSYHKSLSTSRVSLLNWRSQTGEVLLIAPSLLVDIYVYFALYCDK